MLQSFAWHVETGEPLPEELYRKLCAARTYRAGSLMLRQLYFACLDIALHHHFDRFTILTNRRVDVTKGGKPPVRLEIGFARSV